MKAVILAGGAGTRLRPVTYEIPKPLVPVRKKPIINHLIELFQRHNINEVAILASKSHEDDFRRWQKAWEDELAQAKINIFYEEKPRGTFGGLQMLKEWLGDKNFVLTNGDELKDLDLGKLIEIHLAQAPIGTIALVQAEKPQEYGVPILDGTVITQFLEKPEDPPSNFINSGLYVFSPGVFDYADFSQEHIMTEKDIFPKLAAEGRLHGFKIENGRWYDCGNLERWEKAMREW